MTVPECPKELLAEINVLISDEPPLPFSSPMEQSRLLAIQRVAMANQIPLQHQNVYPEHCSIEDIAQIESFRVRQVQLGADWWKYDNGHLLGQLKKGKELCALIYKKGHYWLLSKNQTAKRIDEAEARLLTNQAYYFYQSFNPIPMSLRKLLPFVWPTIGRDFIRMGLLQLTIGLLALFVPIATAKLFSDVIPSSDKSLLVQWTLALLVNVVLITGLSVNELISGIRLRFKINRLLQSALWDRILSLNVNIFKAYTVGDLAMRVNTFDQLQLLISTSVLQGIMQSIFGLIALPLMFYYNVWLGLCSSFVISIFAFVYFQGLAAMLAYQRQTIEITGRINGLFIQFIQGISRIRTTHSESLFFSVWANKFLEGIQKQYKEQMTQVLLMVYNVTYPLLLTILIFGLTKYLGEQLKFADFIGFNAAFTLFMIAILGLVAQFSKLIQARSWYERIQPILSVEPEREPVPYNHQRFSGSIEIHALSFHIRQDRNANNKHEASFPILREINLLAEAGDYIALVGPSGAGKSTLFRLLLGFETPSSGHILYDGHDLMQLNKASLRHQLGVVLQGDKLFSGTLFDNICCNRQITINEAWDIADFVEMADDIRAMPMGMHTLITENGRTLSSGQRQRLLIARALSHRPNILLLDEATSMLDNLTLSKIHSRLSQEKITRIVIAQRINTIREANCIYVLDGGRIVQQGTFEALANHPGWFQKNLRDLKA